MNRLLSNKQKSYIVWRLENSLPNLFARIPKNNEKYPNVRADYRRIILSDKISNFTMDNATTVIDLIKKGDEKGTEQMIWGILGL